MSLKNSWNEGENPWYVYSWKSPKEAGSQLLLQAFLQRVLNEGGLGHRRTDLLLGWPLDKSTGFFGTVQRVVIELKLLHASRTLEFILPMGLKQTSDYADRVGADEAHLVIFHRDSGKSWDERIWNLRERFGKWDVGGWGG